MIEITRHRQVSRAARRAALVCSLLVTAAGATRADATESPAGSDDAAAVQPFVSETTVVVLKLEPTRIRMPDVKDHLKSISADAQAAYEQWAIPAQQGLERLRSATGGQAVYATVGIPISKSQWPVFLFTKQTPELNPDTLLGGVSLAQAGQSCTRGEYFVVTPVDTANVSQLLDKFPPSPRFELAASFAAVNNYPIQVVLLPPDYLRRTVQELMPQLPAQLGGGPSQTLTSGLRWASLGVDPGQLRCELVVQSDSADAAREFAEYLPRLLQSVCEATPDIRSRIQPETVRTLIGLLKPQLAESRITVALEGKELIVGNLQLLGAVAQTMLETTDRRVNGDRFKQILLAMHNYHDKYRAFPPGESARDASGGSPLSWRVHLLPFLGEAELFKEFHLNEAWDSPHNKALLERMPDVYKARRFYTQSDREAKPGYTTFLAPVGDDTVLGGTQATSIRDIRDGTSNTVVLVEVKPDLAVPWTAPDDYRFDPKAPATGLQVGTDGRFLAGLADGSSIELRGDSDPAPLLRLFKKNDGELVDWEKVR